jgi:GNAT superfamily N-acetyltransferase
VSLTFANGYTELAAGKIASVVTYLEMRDRPALPAEGAPEAFEVRRVERPDLEWYRTLFRRIGSDWLWFSRLQLTDRELRAIVHDDRVDVLAQSTAGETGGLLELDRRAMPDIEIALFGIVPAFMGRGAGRALMQAGLNRAWSFAPRRVWLHTCTLDHPRALRFYLQSGFTAYKRAIEIADDPRQSGALPRTAAPHVPLIEPGERFVDVRPTPRDRAQARW